MISFPRSIVFRHTLIYLGLFVFSEVLIFAVLYVSTVTVYERRIDATLDGDLALLVWQASELSIPELVRIIDERGKDEPGENDEYLLVDGSLEYVAGNIRSWPASVAAGAPRADLAVLGSPTSAGQAPERHRLQAVKLPNGYQLLIGRNLSELEEIRALIGRALGRTIALTLLLGSVSGFLFSRQLSRRLDQISRQALAILKGDLGRRLPVSRRGDEYDSLVGNINRMLDQIQSLMGGVREVTDSIAHDMRQPISRLRSRIELSLLGQADPASHEETLRGCLEELDRILVVFNALLAITLAESGARREFQEFDLVDVARSTLEAYEPVAEEAGLTLQLQLGSDVVVPLQGNPHLIAQALANLIDNAVKYAPAGGDVRITARRTPRAAELVVSDRGPGIPQQLRERALQRFGRLDEARTTPGSGLGLSLVQAVVRLHGGSLRLEDNNPGLRVVLGFEG